MTLKTYLLSIISGVFMLLGSPIMLGIIFLSGDSCCGENTSGNILLVTAVISVLTLFTAMVINLIGSLFVKKKKPEFNFLIGSAITWVISSSIYWLFAIGIITTAF